MRVLFRVLAIAIGVAALIDPPVRIAARGRARIAVELAPGPATTARVRDDVWAQLRKDFDVVAGRDETADATVIVGAAYPVRPVPDAMRAYTVTTTSRSDAAGRLVAVEAPKEVPGGSPIRLVATVEGASANTDSIVVVRNESGIELARATHSASTSPRWSVGIDVPPVGVPPWQLRVALFTVDQRDDAAADVLVDAAAAVRVFVLEPRPSWTATFVRRALERDARIDTIGIAYPSRGVSVTTGGAAAALQSLDPESVRAIVVGGLDALTAGDAQMLARFMRDRGGSVVLVPDSLADLRAAGRWLPMPGLPPAETLLEKPARLAAEAPLPSFDASEILKLQVPSASRVLARLTGGSEPVVATIPVGSGRLTVSGALDAWRYRAGDNEAFDRFWQAAVYGLASESRASVDVDVTPSVARPGEHVDVRVRVRESTPRAASLRAAAALAGAGEPIRLWPDADRGVYHGAFVASRRLGLDRVNATAGGLSGRTSFVVASDARTPRPQAPPLSLVADSHRGIDVTADRVGDLVRRLRQDLTPPPVVAERRPMRSIWWIAPFAACLGAEWWMRRRSGLK
jgi:hypothetical protein